MDQNLPFLLFLLLCFFVLIFFSFKKEVWSWVLVAHTYNPSYSGGRDQEDCSLKPSEANSSRDPILKKPFIHKKVLVEWLKV
jgi:hypothetical protein